MLAQGGLQYKDEHNTTVNSVVVVSPPPPSPSPRARLDTTMQEGVNHNLKTTLPTPLSKQMFAQVDAEVCRQASETWQAVKDGAIHNIASLSQSRKKDGAVVREEHICLLGVSSYRFFRLSRHIVRILMLHHNLLLNFPPQCFWRMATFITSITSILYQRKEKKKSRR